jgi:hypothetical protein
VHDEGVNLGEIVLSIVVVWSVLSIVVSLAVGGMAKARDTGTTDVSDRSLMTGRLAPGTVAPRGSDEGNRAVM